MSQRPRGRRPVQEITEPQRRTLKEIRLFTNRRGFPPTMKELADILGISHASVHGQVSQLVRKGYLKREPRKARGIAIVREPEAFFGSLPEEAEMTMPSNDKPVGG